MTSEQTMDPPDLQPSPSGRATPGGASLPTGRGLTVRRDAVAALTLTRRSLLQALGATAALAALPGCVRKPPRQVVSRETRPEFRVPGQALSYASTWTEGRYPYGLVVKTVEGRPVKVDGNPDHPVNRGGSSAAIQASLLSLYDPARLRAPIGAPSLGDADRQVREALSGAHRALLLTRATLGPSERAAIARLLQRWPTLRHLAYEPAGDRARRTAWRELYGEAGEWLPRFGAARVVLAVGCDFLATDGVELEAARDWADARQPDDTHPARTRLPRTWVAEGDLSLTGANADHRLRLRPSAYGALLSWLRRSLAGGAAEAELAALASAHGLDPALLRALRQDLASARGEALVVAGAGLPGPIHAVVALLNEELGAPGRTLQYNPQPPALVPAASEEIAAAFERGLDLALFIGVNPVFSWPGGDFGALLARVPRTVAHALTLDETAAACQLVLPSHHNYESWNDAAPRPGLTSYCQPVVRPLYGSRQEADSLLRWAEVPGGFAALVRTRFAQELPAGASPLAWAEALRRGVRLLEPSPVTPPALDRLRAEQLAASLVPATPGPAPGEPALELTLRPHPAVDDGRFATNAYLLELPDPLARLMWDNALRLAPRTAARLGLTSGALVTVQAGQQQLELPVLIVPGVAEGVVGGDLGLGRRRNGEVVAGFNTWPLAAGGLAGGIPVTLRDSGRTYPLVQSQPVFETFGRPIVLSGTVRHFVAQPQFVQRARHRPHAPTLYDQAYGDGPKWGAAVDLHRCIGCGACVVACQAENNVPAVGKDQCALGRELHWLRIDLYRTGDPDDPVLHFEPMFCQHCNRAPCENVCPVNASAHSDDGLNEQVYNRCVGTRYCANNCPWKVRRFNFYRYTERFYHDEVHRLLTNPDVTVRGVGVMEKCTFCIQRINAAKFRAANEGRPVGPDEVVLACQQACPTQAISFGDLAAVRRGLSAAITPKLRSPRAFGVLEELNTGPNVAYLARLRNEVVERVPGEHGGHGPWPIGGHDAPSPAGPGQPR